MKMKRYIIQSLLPLVLILGGLAFSACSDDIESGLEVDEGAYGAVTRVDGMLLDLKTNKNESVVELRSDSYETQIYFRLTQAPQMGVDVKIEVDPSYVETYNAARGTAFEAFPGTVTIARDGALLLAPDETRSVSVGIRVEAGETLKEDVTYLLPLCVSSLTDGISLSEDARHAVYLVKDMRSQSDTYKGPDAVKTVLYFEVNDTNPLNALEFVMKDSGKLFWDEVILFSANINYNADQGRVYVYNNPNVQFLLDNSEEFLQPLRKRGIKVILGILGNHDMAGVAQLSDMGAREFAKELAAYCEAYNLDGIGFDDEYSSSPDLSNPWFTAHSAAAAARLCYETKRAMPDKTVMVYYLGGMHSRMPAVDGVEPGQFVDYAVADYGGAAAPMVGMTLKQCGGMSWQLRYGGGDEDSARRVKERGYGYGMCFALDPNEYSYQVPNCQAISRGLYDEELLAPTHYYKKNDTTRYPLPVED